MKCCDEEKQEDKKKRGFWTGLLYGLIPHIGCIAFIVFTILGVTAATSLFKPLLLNPYFFHILVALSIVFATISAFLYLKKQGFIRKGLIRAGLKRKWKYLLTLYGTTVGINLLLFMIIFPIAANFNSGTTFTAAVIGAFGGGGELELSDSDSLITLQVKIPCPGHAPLIIGELKTIDGVSAVKFKFPNSFDVGYNPEKTSREQILSLDVFNTYKATVLTALNEDKGNVEGLLSSCCTGAAGAGCGCGCGSQ